MCLSACEIGLTEIQTTIMRPASILFLAASALASPALSVEDAGDSLVKRVSCVGTHVVPGTAFEACGFYSDVDNSLVFECPYEARCFCVEGKAQCYWV